MIIAMDGPAGAGKSTISQRLAESLGFVRLDTGALYRAVALAATRAHKNTTDSDLLAFASALPLKIDREGKVFIGDEDVSLAIRTPEISAASSQFAAVPAVREALLGLQRKLGRSSDSILDGRDIGTVVFPDADVKIFLTASVEVRAERRHLELLGRGVQSDLEQVKKDIIARDYADEHREIAPLRRADDAVLVDASHLSIDEAVQKCKAIVESKRNA